MIGMPLFEGQHEPPVFFQPSGTFFKSLALPSGYFHSKPIATMNITFNELRGIKDSLPDGSIHRIAKELDLNVETVWNYFGGYSHPEGRPMGVHLEGGGGGGVVSLDDTRILDIARRILKDQPQHA